MKAIITYEYNLPEDIEEYEIMGHTHDYKFIISDTKTLIRNFLEYGHKFQTVEEALKAVQQHIFELEDDYGMQRK